MRNQVNKARVNITVDPYLLELFASYEPIHGKLISNFVEEKLLEYIQEIAPDKCLEFEIKKMKAKVAEMEESLPAVKYAAKQLRESKLKENAERKSDNGLEKERLKTLEKYLPSLVYQIENRRKHDWQSLQKDLGFKTLTETQDYVNGQLEARGII